MIEHKDTLLYFLSTVPQVLGALLALTGVFFVLFIDARTKKVFSVTQEMIDNFDNTKWKEQLDNELNDKDIYKNLRKVMNRIKWSQIGYDLTNLKYYTNELHSLVTEKYNEENEHPKVADIYHKSKALINRVNLIHHHRKVTIKLFILNGIIIFLFIVGFCLVPRIICDKSFYQIVFFIGILLTGISLFTIINFISNVVREA